TSGGTAAGARPVANSARRALTGRGGFMRGAGVASGAILQLSGQIPRNPPMAAPQKRYHVAADSAEAAQILDAIDRWLTREVAPHVMKLEYDDVWPAGMVEQMKALGLFGATISPDYGGLGLSAELYARIVSRISETWMSLTGI